MATATKIQAAKIQLHRAEGAPHECITVQFAGAGCWEAADLQLAMWARTAPDAGDGYHKVDVRITFADGETYRGRYDLQALDRVRVHQIERHIRETCELVSLRHEGLTMAQVAAIGQIYPAEAQARAARFLDDYELG